MNFEQAMWLSEQSTHSTCIVSPRQCPHMQHPGAFGTSMPCWPNHELLDVMHTIPSHPSPHLSPLFCSTLSKSSSCWTIWFLRTPFDSLAHYSVGQPNARGSLVHFLGLCLNEGLVYCFWRQTPWMPSATTCNVCHSSCKWFTLRSSDDENLLEERKEFTFRICFQHTQIQCGLILQIEVPPPPSNSQSQSILIIHVFRAPTTFSDENSSSLDSSICCPPNSLVNNHNLSLSPSLISGSSCFEYLSRTLFPAAHRLTQPESALSQPNLRYTLVGEGRAYTPTRAPTTSVTSTEAPRFHSSLCTLSYHSQHSKKWTETEWSAQEHRLKKNTRPWIVGAELTLKIPKTTLGNQVLVQNKGFRTR